MENKEVAIVGGSFLLVIGLAMFMFISQQKNNNMVKETNELKTIIEKNNEELKNTNAELKASLDSLNLRMDETDSKFHKQ
jgi:ABC-type nickel/cobalt efflux system permease component RcnA